jgi:hypothetical protein
MILSRKMYTTTTKKTNTNNNNTTNKWNEWRDSFRGHRVCRHLHISPPSLMSAAFLVISSEMFLIHDGKFGDAIAVGKETQSENKRKKRVELKLYIAAVECGSHNKK